LSREQPETPETLDAMGVTHAAAAIVAPPSPERLAASVQLGDGCGRPW
jgi:hypothetical protein